MHGLQNRFSVNLNFRYQTVQSMQRSILRMAFDFLLYEQLLFYSQSDIELSVPSKQKEKPPWPDPASWPMT